MLFVRDQEASAERLRKSENSIPKVSSPKSVKVVPPVLNNQPNETISSGKTVNAGAVQSGSRKSRYPNLNRSLSESIEEVNESDILDEHDNNDYSDDFEESHLNLSTYSTGSRVSPVKTSTGTKHVTMSEEVAAVPTESTQPLFKRVNPPTTSTSVWNMERPPATRESVVDPLKQSLAHSLLSSQVCYC